MLSPRPREQRVFRERQSPISKSCLVSTVLSFTPTIPSGKREQKEGIQGRDHKIPVRVLFTSHRSHSICQMGAVVIPKPLACPADEFVTVR